MSMATELVAHIQQSILELDKRTAQFVAYKEELWKVSSQLEATLAGSTRPEERVMRARLVRTIDQVDDTIAQIQRSKDMLQVVLRNI